ncbi:MAG: hypothetical protein RIS92_791 [Verrucomicrobiota bacterium]|jgi:hypothetical protein
MIKSSGKPTEDAPRPWLRQKTVLQNLVQLLAQECSCGFAEALQSLVDKAMFLARSRECVSFSHPMDCSEERTQLWFVVRARAAMHRGLSFAL